jgi:hypothetical protein
MEELVLIDAAQVAEDFVTFTGRSAYWAGGNTTIIGYASAGLTNGASFDVSLLIGGGFVNVPGTAGSQLNTMLVVDLPPGEYQASVTSNTLAPNPATVVFRRISE